MKKILLVLMLLFTVAANASTLTNDIKSSINNGDLKTKYEVTHESTANLGEAIGYCVGSGYYSESNYENGKVVLYVDASPRGLEKQAAIYAEAENQARGIMRKYKNCSSTLFFFGVYSKRSYTGNLWYGCGQRFVEQIRAGEYDLEFGTFDYFNMYYCVTTVLFRNGLSLRVVDEKDDNKTKVGIFYGEVRPVDYEAF